MRTSVFCLKECLLSFCLFTSAVCDMATANIVLHLDYYDRVYSGYPFSATYCVGVFAQQEAAVSHKSGEVFVPAPKRE